MTDFHDLNEIARSLREGVGRELQEEAATDEALTELQRLRRRTLPESIRAAMHRGDRVSVRIAGLSLAFPIHSVGDDYATLADADTFVDIRLAHAMSTVTSVPKGGTSGRPAARTFGARLAEHEQDGNRVEIFTRQGDSVDGVIRVAARDHLIIDTGERSAVYVPTDLVSVVFSRFPPRMS